MTSLFETSTASAIRDSSIGRYFASAKNSDSLLVSGAASVVDRSLNLLNWGVLRVGVPVEKADASLVGRVRQLQVLSSKVASFDPFDLVDSVLDATLPEEREVPPMPEHQPLAPAKAANQLPSASLVSAVARPSVLATRAASTWAKTRALSSRATRVSLQYASKQHAAKVAPVISSVQARLAPVSSLLHSFPSVATLVSSSASIALAARSQIVAIPSLQHWFDKLPLSLSSLAKSTDSKLIAVLERAQAVVPASSPREEQSVAAPEETAQVPESPKVLEEQDSGFIFEPSQDFDESE